jgi:hypothetical protein
MEDEEDGKEIKGLMKRMMVYVEREIERVKIEDMELNCKRCRDEDVIEEDKGVV